MGKSVLINRNGAYGDIIHISHLPRLLKDNGYDDIGIATGFKGKQLLQYNPFINRIHYFEPGGRDISVEFFRRRINVLGEMYDEVIDLHHSLEVNALVLECQNDYYQHQNIRAKRGKHNYYDISTKISGFPELCGRYKGEIFYTGEETAIVEHDLLRPGRFKDNFKILINLAGSGAHKVFIQAREITVKILDKYPDAVIFTTGDSRLNELDLTDLSDKVHSIVAKKPFRQVLLMAKYMDCVIGCESGIMCGASMWNTPAIQLLTATDRHNHCKYAENDYSLQSPAKCSPCYKGPYKYYGCPRRNNLPICVYFDIDTILLQIDKIYNKYVRSGKQSNLLSRTA